jgi:hypothetical protein
VIYNDQEMTFIDYQEELMKIEQFVELEDDFYCYVYASLLKSETCSYRINTLYKQAFLINCVQVGLICLYYFSARQRLASDSNYSSYLTRFLCAFVLHLMVLPEIKTGMQMYQYQRRLDHNKVPTVIRSMIFDVTTMKILSAMMCEIVNTQIITTSETNEDIIKDFVVMGFIIEIDNLFAKALLTQEQIESITETKLYIQDFKIKETGQKISWFHNATYEVLKEYHFVICFYILPYWVIFFSFFGSAFK